MDRILANIPPERIDDVVLVDLSDEQFSVGFNILSAHSDLEKNLLASDLVSVFQRLSTSWGDQMGSVLSNAILAFLESERGGTLADLRRFLIEPAFREKFLATVRDPDIVYYWKKGFPQLSGNKSIGPVLTRLETFLSPKPIRYMVSQRENRLDFAHILDTGKIFLAKLPQGQMGKENAFLLGSLLVAKFQQLAMSRQAQRAESRRPFWLYVDEFQNFITPSMAEILAGARKYRLGLILAHQELRQLQRDTEVASAVLSTPYTRIVFKVGDADARALENGFANFEARDLQNLETGQAICRVEKAAGDFNLTIPLPEEPAAAEAEQRRQQVIAASRAKYATPRAEIEAALRAKLDAEEAEPRLTKTKPAPPPERKASEPKAAEVPKVTVSENEPPPLVAAVAPEIPKAVEPPPPPSPDAEAKSATIEPVKPYEPGRGGPNHKSIQKRLQRVGEELGYIAEIEKRVLGGAGCVDIAFARDQVLLVACEVNISSTIADEVEHVRNDRLAGYPHVAVVATEPEQRVRIQAAVAVALPAAEAACVGYYSPDEFETYLRQLARVPKVLDPPVQPGAPKEKIIKGLKVRFHHPPLTGDEQQAKEALAIRQMQEQMKAKP